MRYFEVVCDSTITGNEARLLSTMWRVAYFVSWDESNGYMTYTFGQQYAMSSQSDIENILTANEVVFLSVNFGD